MLLERSDQLAALSEALAEARDGSRGTLALVAGEAGVGKTTLVREFTRAEAPRARVLWGTCDALFTPAPLAPLIDVAEQVGGSLAELVEGAKYGSFPAACHYADGQFVPASAESECTATAPGSGAAFTFWHPRLITLHVWLWYPNPDGLYASTNPFVAPFTSD